MFLRLPPRDRRDRVAPSRRLRTVIGPLARLSCVCALGLSGTQLAVAQVQTDIGYSALKSQQGGILPTGAGIAVIQVEAYAGGTSYAPDATATDFTGKTITTHSGVSPASGHATIVGQQFYGNTTSMTPGITTIDSYYAGQWAGSGYLKYASSLDPISSPSGARITNHSWVGTGNTTNETYQILLRTDWLVEQDDHLQIVGTNNNYSGNPPLLTSGRNVISVGLSNQSNGYDSSPIGTTIYSNIQTRPDIVAPDQYTSFATPLVSSAAALLMAGSQANAAWSTAAGSSVPFTYTARSGLTIRAAETSEVMRAALMAGADRWYVDTTGPALIDYRIDALNQTTNGLDRRVGAGQLNVRNSWNILAGGLQHSRENGNTLDLKATGFDYRYDAPLIAETDAKGTYEFVGAFTGQEFSATLAWNAKVNMTLVKAGAYDAAGSVDNLDLRLYDITGGGNTLIASSTSTFENTENIFTQLTAGRRYRLEVANAVGTAFTTDYGLAWNGALNQLWTGAVDGVWNTDATANWQRGTSVAKFLAKDRVVFDDTSNSNTISIPVDVVPDKVIFNNSSKTYTLNGPGRIIGQGTLVKNGTGILVLTTAHSYSGGTFLNEGRILVGVDNALPTGGALDIGTAGTLDVNGKYMELGNVTGGGTIELGGGTFSPSGAVGGVEFSGTLAGSGTFRKSGGSIQTLSGNLLTPNLNVSVLNGTLRFAATSSSTSQFTTAPNVNVGGTGTLELAGTKSLLADNAGHYAAIGVGGVVNVTGTNQRVGTVSGGGTFKVFTGADITVSSFALNTFEVQTGGKLIVAQNGGNAGTGVVNAPPSIAGKLDLRDNDLVQNYSGALGTLLTDAASLIRSARNGTDVNGVTKWDGNGIGSSFARTENVMAGFDLYTLGVINNGDLTTIGIGSAYTTFDGVAIDPTTILYKYTYSGDADLNGIVNLDDRTYWLNGYQNALPPGITGWLAGDFNYDQRVDLDDYTLWLNAYQQSGGQMSLLSDDPFYLAITAAAIPEPSVWLGGGCAALAGCTALRRRRTGLSASRITS
ncbi:MAG: autotransporter-associated beta strand repeat-containing protein [Pirellulales bacterium]